MDHVLVIEDKATVRESLIAMLTSEGYRVDSADNGRTGLQLAGSSRPDLILYSSSGNAGMGDDFVYRLKSDQMMDDIPVLWLSSDQQAETLIGWELEEQPVERPISDLDLLQLIRSNLESHKQKQKQIYSDYEALERIILHDIPGEFAGPLRDLVSSSDLLIHMESVYSNPDQVRSTGRGMRRSASLLAQIVRSYALYKEIRSILLNPERIELYRKQVMQVVPGDIEANIQYSAAEFSREIDLVMEVEEAWIHADERLFMGMLDDLTFRGLRFTRNRTVVLVKGTRGIRSYRLELSIQSLSGEPTLMTPELVEASLSMLLVTQICELQQGSVHLYNGPNGFPELAIEFPLAQAG